MHVGGSHTLYFFMLSEYALQPIQPAGSVLHDSDSLEYYNLLSLPAINSD